MMISQRKLSVLLVLLQAHLRLAFTPPRGHRLRDFSRDRFFAVEHILPPLASIAATPRPRHRTTLSRNGTMHTGTAILGGHRNNGTDFGSSRQDTIHRQHIQHYISDHDDKDALPVLYTNDPKVLNRWLADNIPMEPCVIGFDTESVPDVPWIHSDFKMRPVTIQLSTCTASVVIPLVQNNRYCRACIPLLETVLEDETIIKSGAGIDDDLVDLKCQVPGFKGLQARSRFDVGLLGVAKDRRLGLKALTRILLQRNLEKPKRLTVSDWSQSPLSDDQIAYAARDAWCGAAVLEELQRLDSETFQTDALIDLLRSQPPLHRLAKNRKQRQSAKKQLKSYHHGRNHTNQHLPHQVQQQVSQLQQVLKETQVDLTIVEPLRCIADE
ncbi:Exonuclease [Seminavis robusta]|uniref:Exonuclease n=1 Tax=Seminavis robusta TaxID=568900 RepID=A0A9N8EHA0_9STRA|nr:Exonuclease [Seminavis robusta]|eukprot:Sro1203_g252040.1 Exonuclease (383) ;mRNA; f:6171-7520